MELSDYLALQNKRKRPHRSEEADIQISVVAWLKAKYPDVLFTMSPAGVKMSIGQAVKMKKMGYRSGTPDLLIDRAVGRWHGLRVEIKTDMGIASPEQLQWQRKATAEGYCSLITRGLNKTKEAIQDYLEGRVL